MGCSLFNDEIKLSFSIGGKYVKKDAKDLKVTFDGEGRSGEILFSNVEKDHTDTFNLDGTSKVDISFELTGTNGTVVSDGSFDVEPSEETNTLVSFFAQSDSFVVEGFRGPKHSTFEFRGDATTRDGKSIDSVYVGVHRFPLSDRVVH